MSSAIEFQIIMDEFVTSGGDNISDSAFERFLTSAVATILTIIFSLRFLLDAERLEYRFDEDDLNNSTNVAQPACIDNDHVTKPANNNNVTADLHIERGMDTTSGFVLASDNNFKTKRHNQQRHVDKASRNDADGEARQTTATPPSGYVADRYGDKRRSLNMNKVSQVGVARYDKKPGDKKDVNEYESDDQKDEASNTSDDDASDDDDDDDEDDDEDEDNIEDLIEYETDYPSEFYYYGHELEAITEEDSDDLRSVSSLGARRDNNNIENNSEYETESVVSDISSIDVSYELPSDLSVLEGLRKYGRSGSFVNTQRPLVIGPYRDNYSTFTKDRYLTGDGQLQWTIDGQNSDPTQFKADTNKERHKKSVSFQGEEPADSDGRKNMKPHDRKEHEITGNHNYKQAVKSHTSIIPKDNSTFSKTTVLTFTMPDRKQQAQDGQSAYNVTPVNQQIIPGVTPSRHTPVLSDTGAMSTGYKETDIDTLLSHDVLPSDKSIITKTPKPDVSSQWRIQPNMGVRSVGTNRNRNYYEPGKQYEYVHHQNIPRKGLYQKNEDNYQRRKSGATIINLSDYFDGALSSCTDKIPTSGFTKSEIDNIDGDAMRMHRNVKQPMKHINEFVRDTQADAIRNFLGDNKSDVLSTGRRQSEYDNELAIKGSELKKNNVQKPNNTHLLDRFNKDEMENNESPPPINLWTFPGDYYKNRKDNNSQGIETTFPTNDTDDLVSSIVAKTVSVTRPKTTSLRHKNPSVRCTALATSTALAKKDYKMSVSTSPNDLAKSVVSSVANAEATGDNPYIAIARASARAAAMASANATSSIAQKSDSDNETTDISVVISTSCSMKGDDMEVIRENTKDVMDALGEETKVSVRTQGLGYSSVDATNSASIALPTPPQKRRVIITVDKPKNKRDNPLMIETIIPEGVTNEDLSSIISSAVKKTLTNGSKIGDNYGHAVEIPESNSSLFINTDNDQMHDHVSDQIDNTGENAYNSNIGNNKTLLPLRDPQREGQVDKKLIANKDEVVNNAEPVNKLNIDYIKGGSFDASDDVNIHSNRHVKQFKENVNIEKSIADRAHSTTVLSAYNDRLIEQDEANQETPKHTQHTPGNEISTFGGVNDESAVSPHRPTDKGERNAQSLKQVNARGLECSSRPTRVPQLTDGNGEHNNVLKKSPHIKCPRVNPENSAKVPTVQKVNESRNKPAPQPVTGLVEAHKNDDLLLLSNNGTTTTTKGDKIDALRSPQKLTSQQQSSSNNAVKSVRKTNVSEVLVPVSKVDVNSSHEKPPASSRVSTESSTKPSQIKQKGEDKTCKLEQSPQSVCDKSQPTKEKCNDMFEKENVDGDITAVEKQKPKQPYTSVLLNKPEDKRTPLELLKQFELPEKTPPAERVNINSARKGFIVENEPPVTVENSWILQKLESKQQSWKNKPKPRPPSLVLVDIDIEDTEEKKKRHKKSIEDIKSKLNEIRPRAPPSPNYPPVLTAKIKTSKSHEGALDEVSEKTRSLPAQFKAKSVDNVFRRTPSTGSIPNLFFTDRTSRTSLIETDIDTGEVRETPVVMETDLDKVFKEQLTKTRSLVNLSSAASMSTVEFREDIGERNRSFNTLPPKQNDRNTMAPYNNGRSLNNKPQHLKVNVNETEHEKRISNSLNKLNVPEWYTSSTHQITPIIKRRDFSNPRLHNNMYQDENTKPVVAAKPLVIQHRISTHTSRLRSAASNLPPALPQPFSLPSAKLRHAHARELSPVSIKSPDEIPSRNSNQSNHTSEARLLLKACVSKPLGTFDWKNASQNVASDKSESDNTNPSGTFVVLTRQPNVSPQIKHKTYNNETQANHQKFDFQKLVNETLSQDPTENETDMNSYSHRFEALNGEGKMPEPEKQLSPEQTSLITSEENMMFEFLRKSRENVHSEENLVDGDRHSGMVDAYPVLTLEMSPSTSRRGNQGNDPKHVDLKIRLASASTDNLNKTSENNLNTNHSSLDDLLGGLLDLPEINNPSPKTETIMDNGFEMSHAGLQESPKFTLKSPLNVIQSSPYISPDTSSEDASPSSDNMPVTCRNPKCKVISTLAEAKKTYKTCHNCYTYYCSRQCRKIHWERHKKKCLYGRVNSACKHVIKSIHDNEDSLHQISRVARTGYLTRGRGCVILPFLTSEQADYVVKNGISSMETPPTYVSIKDLEEYDWYGDHKYLVLEMARSYNPEIKFVINVAISCERDVIRKLPVARKDGTTIKKCAKLRLSSAHISSQAASKSEPDTLILTAVPGSEYTENMEEKKAREICFINIQRKLRQKGVSLRHQFPDVYNALCNYVSDNTHFAPITIYPVDRNTGRSFMCLIMPNSEPEVEWVQNPDLIQELDLSTL